MTTFLRTVAAACVALFAVSAPLQAADDRLSVADAQALVQPFYDLLDTGTSVDAARAVFHEDWRSFYSTTGYKGLDETLAFLSGPLREMVPDLTWKIQAVSVTDANEIVVRGEATGTPAGEHFFGQPVTGKSFRIMSIDVHKVEDGKVVESHHIEDWAGALRQLAADG